MTRSSLLTGALLCMAFLPSFSSAAESFPDPQNDIPKTAEKGKQAAVFAGGCFWCTEAVFEQLAGVQSVVSGYAGGTKATADYKTVSAGMSEHAEAIQIMYDPSVLTYGQLLKVFFSAAHDPTQLNRQGPDHGKQYRSAVFYSSEEQKKLTADYIDLLNRAKVFDKPIVTQVAKLEAFYTAEEYHQDFVRRNPGHSYVVVNALPKIQKVRKQFGGLVKSDGKKK